MTVLSDSTIKTMIEKNLLVPGGDTAQARACSYQFLPGRIFTAGVDGKVIDWEHPLQESEVERSHFVQPGQLVWIRPKGRVCLPNDICAFWWQTSTLSRKGLMLVNMSMVEPGYDGRLACLFVNFGNSAIRIAPDTVVAKLVFARLDKEVSSPCVLRVPPDKYDGDVHDGAVNGPATFLRVADMWSELTLKRDKVEAELNTLAVQAKGGFTDAIKIAGDEGVAKFREDIKSGFFKSFGWAIAGFVIVLAAVTFVPWLQGLIRPDIGKVLEDKIDNAVSKRLLIPPALQETDVLKQRLAKVEDQLRTLRAQPDAKPGR